MTSDWCTISQHRFLFFLNIFESLHDLFPVNLSSWRTKEIFVQTVSSHLSQLSQWGLDTRVGVALAQTRGLHRDNREGACVCVGVCVCVWIMLEWAEVGKGRESSVFNLTTLFLSVFPNPFLQTSSSNRFRDPLLPPLPIPPSLLCHTPSTGVSSYVFLPLPLLFPPSIELSCMGLSAWCWFDSKQMAFSCVNIYSWDFRKYINHLFIFL